jgi:hypothetical protein
MEGTAQPSFLLRSLEDIAESEDKERLERMIENIGAMYTAGMISSSGQQSILINHGY